jgi:hypothetical protein
MIFRHKVYAMLYALIPLVLLCLQDAPPFS